MKKVSISRNILNYSLILTLILVSCESYELHKVDFLETVTNCEVTRTSVVEYGDKKMFQVYLSDCNQYRSNKPLASKIALSVFDNHQDHLTEKQFDKISIFIDDFAMDYQLDHLSMLYNNKKKADKCIAWFKERSYDSLYLNSSQYVRDSNSTLDFYQGLSFYRNKLNEFQFIGADIFELSKGGTIYTKYYYGDERLNYLSFTFESGTEDHSIMEIQLNN